MEPAQDHIPSNPRGTTRNSGSFFGVRIESLSQQIALTFWFSKNLEKQGGFSTLLENSQRKFFNSLGELHA